MFIRHLLLAFGLCGLLSGCFDNDHPPQGAGGLAAQTKVIDKAKAVNETVQAQDDSQRKAMDEQGQ